MTPKTIAIIGGGIAGPALALFLKREGINAVIYEGRFPNDHSGGGLGLAMNGMRVMDQLGLADKIRAAGSTYSGFRFFNQHGKLLTDIEDQKTDQLKTLGVCLPRQSVHEVLVDELHQENIQIHFGKKLKSLDLQSNNTTCVFEDGHSITADIVIAADGLNSRVRNIIMPEAPKPEYTGILGFGGFIPEDKIPAQFLPATNRMEMIFGNVGFFGYARAGLKNGRPMLLWWNATPGKEINRKEIFEMNDQAKKAFLLELHRGWCKPVETIIQESDLGIFADNIYDIKSLPSWSNGNILLIGDAAHAVSPHAGQGASMALEDAWYLARALKSNLHDPQKAFQEFEKIRRTRVEKVVQLGRRSGNSKKKVGPVGAWVRDRFVTALMPTLVKNYTGWLYDKQTLAPDMRTKELL